MADKTIPALKILRGNVGISTATPAVKLHVEGNDIRVNTEGSYQAKTLYFRYSSGAAINSDSYLTLGTGGSPAERMRVISNGNIGIATTIPGAKLDVNGSAIFRGAAGWAGNDNQACAIYLNTAGRGVMGNFSNYARNLVKANSNYVEVGQNSTLVYGVKFIVGSNAPNGFMFQSNIGGTMTTHMSIRGNNGSVGIGTANPESLLTISGNSDDGDSACALRIIDEDTTGGSKLPAIMFYGGSTIQGRIRGGDGTFAIAVGSTPTTAFSINTTSRKIAFGSYGSGTHTGTAAYKLAVDSSGNVIETAVGAGQVDGSGTANYISKWTDGDTLGNASIYDNGSNRISLGTINTSPWQALDVRSTGSQFSDGAGGNQNYNITVVDQNAYTANYAGGILFGGKYNSSGAVTTLGIVSASKVSGNGNHGGKVHVGGRENGTATVPKVLTVTHANVGIGTISPDSLLHLSSASSPQLRIQDTTNNCILKGYAQNSDAFFGTHSNHPLNIGAANSTSMTLISGGNVGINTTSPAYKLDVYGGDARVGTNLRLGNGSAAGNSTDPAITVSGVTTAGVYFENSGVGFGAGSGSKYLFLSSAGNASLGGHGFFKQLGDRPYGTDNLNDYYRSNDEASFCQFYRYDATHGHWANSSGTLTTNAPSTLTQTTSQIYSYGSLLTLRSINSFRGQFYFAHSASEFYWRSGWGTSSDQNWTRIVGDRNIQSVIHNVGHISTKAGNNLTVGGSITVQPGSGDGILFLKNSAASQILRLDQNSIRTTTNNQMVLFTNGNSNQLYLSSGGNVGIGTNDPSKKLHVIGAVFIDNTESTGGLTVEATSNANITLQAAQNTAYHATLAAHYNYTTPMTLSGYGGTVLAQNTGVTKTLLYANNAEQIRITTTGVGIGLGGSDPGAKLHVGGSTKIEGPLVGVLNNSFTRIENFILDTKGEDAPVINHQLNNDLALLRVKGNTVTYSGLSSNPGDTETDRFFEANSYFGDIAASEISNASTGFTITLDSLPRNLTYTTRVGISFATPSWRCSYVKIEVYRAGAWTQIREETNNTGATVYQYYNTGSSGITKIRYTLKTPVTTSTRIVSLFAFNYNSTGATGYYLSQAGGSVYGSLNVGPTSSGTLLEVGNDGNTDYALIGPTKIGGGMGHGDYAGFSHRDRSTTTSYALLQHTGGTTYLNSNIRIYMGVNNANYTAQVESDRFQVNNKIQVTNSSSNSEVNIYKSSGSNTDSAILRVGYDSTNSFAISRQRASSSIYLNSGQSGSTVYHQVGSATKMVVNATGVGANSDHPAGRLDVYRTADTVPGLLCDANRDGARQNFIYSGNTTTAGEIGMTYNTGTGGMTLWMGSNLNSNSASHASPTNSGTSYPSWMTFWSSYSDYYSIRRIAAGGGTSAANVFYINSAGSVGIGGITNPGRELDVDGRILSDSYGFRSDTSIRWYYFDNYSGSNFMGRGGNSYTSLYDTGSLSMIWKGSNVGIAKEPNTQYSLDMAGQMLVGGHMSFKAVNGLQGIGFNRNVHNGAIYSSSYYAYQLHSNANNFELQRYNGSGTFLGYGLTCNTSGNIGIGTQSGSAKLHIQSDGSHDEGAEIVLRHANNNSTDVVSTLSFQNNGGQVAMIQAGTTSGSTNGYISFFTDNAGTSAEAMRIDSDHRVQLKATDYQLRYTSGSHVWYSKLGSNGTFAIHKNGVGDYLRVDGSGNVGIGLNAVSSANLHVNYSSGVTDIKAGFLSGTAGPGIRGQNTSTTANTYFPIDFRVHDADARIAFQYSGTSNQGQFLFITENNGSSQSFGIYDRGDGATRVLVNDTTSTGAPNKTFEVKYLSTSTNVTQEGLSGGGAGKGIMIYNAQESDNVYANLDFRARNADGRIAYQYKTATNVGDFHFITDNTGSPKTQMIIKNDGRVGIGTYEVGDGRFVVWGEPDNQFNNDIALWVGSTNTYPMIGIGTDSTNFALMRLRGDSIITNENQAWGTSSRVIINNKSTTAGQISAITFEGGTGWYAGAFICKMLDHTNKYSELHFSTANGSSDISSRMVIGRTGNVGIGTSSSGSYKLEVNGAFAASSKSFVIDHPTKENKKLIHGSLEGPEYGVYHRGTTQSNTITLPDYWSGLVREDTITVQLTPRGGFQHLYVVSASLSQIVIGAAEDETIDCFYTIYGERADIDSLVVEKDV